MNSTLSPPQIAKLDQTSCDQCGEALEVGHFRTFSEISCPVCDHVLSVPGTFNEFLVLEQVEQREEVSIYLALDKSRENYQYLHVFNYYFENENQEKKFLVNVRAASRLKTPYMVHLRVYGVENGFPYVSMDLSNGVPMSYYIDPDVPQDEISCLNAMLHICLAMEDAESEQVLHGDIKPENILLDEQGLAKLTGFGISQFSESYDRRIQGTPLYIAPEKANREWADFRSDQFSLGSSFWHILSGLPPFNGKTAPEIVRSRYSNPQPDIRSVAQQVSEETSLFLQKMMEPEPRSRFPTFQHLIGELEILIDQLEERLEHEEHYRVELEVEAYALHHDQSRRRFKIMGLVIFVFIVTYFIVGFVL